MDVALTELVKEAFNGKTPTKPRIIQALDTVREFNRLEPKRRNDEFSPSYHARLAVAGALVEIFRSFAVLLPVSKYRLQIDKLKIEGEYAVLRRRTSAAKLLSCSSAPTIFQ